MFYVCQFRFVSSHRLLMWTSLLLLLHLISTISMLNDTIDMNVVQDLKEGKRGFIVMGVVKSRLVVVVGSAAARESKVVGQSRFKRQPYIGSSVPVDDYYVFDMSPNSFTGDNKLHLHNGTLFKDKWPPLYEWWKQSREVALSYYFIISDEQHGYLVVIDKNGHTFSYVIDLSPGDKVMTNKRVVNLYFTWLSSSEPMCAFYREILANDYEQLTTRPDSSLGSQLGDHTSDYSNFHLSKTTFKGSNSLPEATWSDDDGGVYLCKATDGQVMTQTDKCTTPLEWDLQGGFVDDDRVVVFDSSSNMHVFPKSALERSNANKTVKVNDIAKTDFVIAGEPPSSGHLMVIGLVVGILILFLVTVAFVVFYFFYVKSSSPANVKATGGTPGGGGSSNRKTTMISKGKQSRQAGGSSSKGQSSARHTKKRANSFKTSNTTTPKGASSRKLKQNKHTKHGSPSKTSHNSKNSKRSKRNRTCQQNSSNKTSASKSFSKKRASKSNKK